MSTEIEAKWLDINTNTFRQNLRAAGAKLIKPEILMRRELFDEPTPFAVYGHGWIRVRDEGDKITMTYKKMMDRTVKGMTDITVEVNDFEKTCDILRSMTLQKRGYQETKREIWELDGAEICIDTWPWIPTFVEIEAADENTPWLVAQKLGLEKSAALHGSVESANQKYYDVTEAEVDDWPEVTFVPVPKWLEKRRLRK